MRNHTLSPRTAKLLAALVVLVLVGALSGLAIAGSSPVSTPHLGSNVRVPSGKAAGMAHRLPSGPIDATSSVAPAPAFTPDPIPAEILGSNVPVPIPASVIAETNGWLVSDGYTLVAVYAGSAGNDPTQGRVVIVRQDLRAGRQTVQTVDAGPIGPLTITADAPAGAAVVTSAQTGSLPLTSSRGARFMLNLSTNTISPS